MKPYSEACERNKEPILSVLRELFPRESAFFVLEIGSGTGQHAVYFAEHMPNVNWQTSDLESALPGINAWVTDAGLENVPVPVVLRVEDSTWGFDGVDAIFSANTAHIMSWSQVRAMIDGAARALRGGGLLCIYGPFNKNGDYTSASNRAFDAALKRQDPAMGIRDLEALDAGARPHGLQFENDYSMPAHNRLLVWRKLAEAQEPSE